MYQPLLHAGRSENRGVSGSSGTTIAAPGSINTKGAWTDLGAVTSFAYEAITVCLQPAAANDFLVDIGITLSGNRFPLIENLYCASLRLDEYMVWVTIPVHVPAGSQLAARQQNSSTSGMKMVVVGHSSGAGGALGFSRCVPLFTSPGSSRAVAIDPGGTANTKGSWTQITSSCPADIGAMFGLIGFNGDITRATTASALFDIGLGASGFEAMLYPNGFVGWSSIRDGPSVCPRIPLFSCAVASGTRIAARAQCSLNTAGDRTFDLALYGLVP